MASYAPNLARWREGDRRVRLRLEIPDFLCGVFQVLERYAHMLKGQNPHFFRHSIKFDVVNLSLVMDYTVEEDGPWYRVDYEEAASCARE